MRILVINGSPRKKGNVATILHHIVKYINEASVQWIDVNDLNISPCIGCMKCRETKICILPHDDAHLIAEEIKLCDVLVIGSPVYWGNISGQIKLLFDRIVPSMMGESKFGAPIPLHKGKKAIIVTACTTIWPFSFLFKQTTKSLRAMKEILHYSGFKVIGKVVYPGTKGKNVIPERLIRKSELLGKKLNKK